MIARQIGESAVRISIVGLGGNEYLPDGRSRGFTDAPRLAVIPGHILPEFGRDRRRTLLRLCYSKGVNLLDVTMDSEKEALGRNLQEVPPPFPVYVQTRPEGMVYGRDPHNAKMANYDALRQEVERGLKLLRRDHLDFLNLGFMRDALIHDHAYLDKIERNIRLLKDARLIRFACLDTFSGEQTYLTGLRAGCFDVVYVSLNPADDGPLEKVLPTAVDQGTAVFVRECFMKGALFAMGEEVGLTDRNRLARVALTWCLTRKGVTSAIVGAHDADQMANNLQVLDDLVMYDDDWHIIETLKNSALFRAYRDRKSAQWLGAE